MQAGEYYRIQPCSHLRGHGRNQGCGGPRKQTKNTIVIENSEILDAGAKFESALSIIDSRLQEGKSKRDEDLSSASSQRYHRPRTPYKLITKLQAPS
jgi:hypothetical protein|tara:strand:+ start:169 stop:459 length:291 start_codon:yes stop_codon:yes gene_type:complete